MQTDDFRLSFIESFPGLSPEDIEELLNGYLFIDHSVGKETPEDYGINYLTERGLQEEITPATEDPYRYLDVGSAFCGVLEIEEYEDEWIYIPSSGECAIKCYNKFYRDMQIGHQIICDKHSMSPRGIQNAVIGAGNDWNQSPRLIRWDCKGGVVRLNSHHQSSAVHIIGLLNIKQKKFHAVLIKPAGLKKLNNGSFSIEITQEYIISKIKVFENKVLSKSSFKLPPITVKKTADRFYVYDLETFYEDGKYFPYACAYQEINIRMHEVEYGEIFLFEGAHTCLEQMFEHLKTQRGCESTNKQYQAAYHLYAHNGGCFDHIYSKTCKNLKFIRQIKSSRIKLLHAEFKDIEDKEIIFKDSYSFTQCSLKESCKMFNTSTAKMEGFDIVKKPLQWFREERKWIPYLKQDVQSLSEVIFHFEKFARKYGESISSNTGIPSLAWRINNKMSTFMQGLHISNSEVTNKFFRTGIKGGRILHWKKSLAEPGVCLDANSLYPTAMAIGIFPVGKFDVLNEGDIDVRDLEQRLARGEMLVAEVTLDAGNIRYPLIPWKNEKGNLVYKAGVFTDIYYSPDLVEAVALGYKIVDVKRCVRWARSERIFADTIETLYNDRMENTKKAKQLNQEGKKNEASGCESMAKTIKILLNSMYGKFLENIKTVSKFGELDPTKRLIRSMTLPNGQIESTYRLNKITDRKPLYLGGFILAYARQIMNRLIISVGPENIAYSDTDSVYVTKNAVARAGLEESISLGGFKNDYGEGRVIIKSIFLDLKRYFLLFNTPDDKGAIYKCKFSGLVFKTKNALIDWNNGIEDLEFPENKEKEDTNEEKKEKQKLLAAEGLKKTIALYEDFEKHSRLPAHECKESCPTMKGVPQEKWMRSWTGVTILDKRLSFEISPEKRAAWDGDEFWPLGYDKKLPERNYPEEAKKDRIAPLEEARITKYIYTMNGHRSALPMVGDILKNRNLLFENFRDGKDKNKDTKIQLSFIQINEQILKLDKTKLYRMSKYGPSEELDIPFLFFRQAYKKQVEIMFDYDLPIPEDLLPEAKNNNGYVIALKSGHPLALNPPMNATKLRGFTSEILKMLDNAEPEGTFDNISFQLDKSGRVYYDRQILWWCPACCITVPKGTALLHVVKCVKERQEAEK